MHAITALTIIWGFEGLLGTLLVLFFSLILLGLGIETALEARGTGSVRRVVAKGRAALFIAIGGCGIVIIVVNVPADFRAQTVQLTVAKLDSYSDEDGTEYTVKDSTGREFNAGGMSMTRS